MKFRLAYDASYILKYLLMDLRMKLPKKYDAYSGCLDFISVDIPVVSKNEISPFLVSDYQRIGKPSRGRQLDMIYHEGIYYSRHHYLFEERPRWQDRRLSFSEFDHNFSFPEDFIFFNPDIFSDFNVSIHPNRIISDKIVNLEEYQGKLSEEKIVKNTNEIIRSLLFVENDLYIKSASPVVATRVILPNGDEDVVKLDGGIRAFNLDRPNVISGFDFFYDVGDDDAFSSASERCRQIVESAKMRFNFDVSGNILELDRNLVPDISSEVVSKMLSNLGYRLHNRMAYLLPFRGMEFVDIFFKLDDETEKKTISIDVVERAIDAVSDIRSVEFDLLRMQFDRVKLLLSNRELDIGSFVM